MTGDTNLFQIDRWHSRPLDVHRWSDHPKIKALTDQLYVECGINSLDKTGNRKPKKTAKDMLRVLLLDLTNPSPIVAKMGSSLGDWTCLKNSRSE